MEKKPPDTLFRLIASIELRCKGYEDNKCQNSTKSSMTLFFGRCQDR
jgi:hypothetical protein